MVLPACERTRPAVLSSVRALLGSEYEDNEPGPPLRLEELVNHEVKPHDSALFCCDS